MRGDHSASGKALAKVLLLEPESPHWSKLAAERTVCVRESAQRHVVGEMAHGELGVFEACKGRRDERQQRSECEVLHLEW